ncbi:GNAT family N-acetyltransferase [Candidatus Microgenomates bacterium]|nr:GNAT family N-acetyltransferase [Candidatus Microgenomates bacterium]
MGDIRFELVEDREKAKILWDILSPHKTIDDEWDFRYQFFKPLSYKLHFIAGYDQEKLIGLLPLQLNTLQGLMPPYYPSDNIPFLECFGGDDTDDNRILMKPGYEQQEQRFLDQITQRAYLAPLQIQYSYKNKEADLYENKYLLSLEGLISYEDYIDKKWSGSSRKKLRQQIRKLYRENAIEVMKNDLSDIDYMAELNKRRFGQNSSFQHEYRADIFKNLAQIYQAEIMSIMVNGKRMGVSYGIKYKDAYLGMNAGVEESLSDLGKLLVLLQIERAIELGCTVYDGGKGSGGWKSEFKFVASPQYILSV